MDSQKDVWGDFVALLAEGVDRNAKLSNQLCALLESPSSRRAWIEIGPSVQPETKPPVALLAEGVDRNSA